MTKLILFDLGKVLVDFDFSVAVQRLHKICTFNPLKLYALFRNSDLAYSWDRGGVEPEAFFQTIQKEMKFPISQEQFMPLWNEIFTEKKEMVSLALSLQSRYKVWILSNTNVWHAAYLKEHYPWMGRVDGFVASCDVKMMKPDRKIYELVLEKAGAAAGETVYIDDIPEYVVAARNLGIDGIQFKNYNKLCDELKRRNIPLP